MDKKTRRTIRKDLTVLTSVALLRLAGLSALTGMGMDEAEAVLPLDDAHEMAGYLMAMSLAFTRSCTSASCAPTWRKRVRELSREAPRAHEP